MNTLDTLHINNEMNTLDTNTLDINKQIYTLFNTLLHKQTNLHIIQHITR